MGQRDRRAGASHGLRGGRACWCTRPVGAMEDTMMHEQITTVEQVISDLETASSRNDVEALVALFAEDATIESYLVSRVFNRKGDADTRTEVEAGHNNRCHRDSRHARDHDQEPQPRQGLFACDGTFQTVQTGPL